MTADSREQQRGSDRPSLIGKAAESRATATLEGGGGEQGDAGRQLPGLSRATA